VSASTFRSTAKTHRRRAGSRYRHTGALSLAVALEGGDRSLTATVQRSSIVTIFCYAHLCRYYFQLHGPLPQRLTITAPFSEVKARTRRRTVVIRSSTSQAPRSMIQVLQSQTVPILKPVNSKEDDVILDTTIDTHATTVSNTAMRPPPPPREEDVPPPSPSPQDPPLPETNKILTNLMNLLQQQSDRLECLEKNEEKILTVVATRIEEAR